MIALVIVATDDQMFAHEISKRLREYHVEFKGIDEVEPWSHPLFEYLEKLQHGIIKAIERTNPPSKDVIVIVCHWPKPPASPDMLAEFANQLTQSVNRHTPSPSVRNILIVDSIDGHDRFDSLFRNSIGARSQTLFIKRDDPALMDNLSRAISGATFPDGSRTPDDVWTKN